MKFSTNKIVYAVPAMLVIVGLFVYSRFFGAPELLIPTNTDYPTVAVSVDKAQLMQGITHTNSIKLPLDGRSIRGGIVPHHDVPRDLLTRFFIRISQGNWETIIFLVPDHQVHARADVVTAAVAWDVQGTTVQPDEAMIKALVARGSVADDENTVMTEHALQAVLPYVATLMPKTKVVPLVFRGQRDMAKMKAMANALVDVCGTDCVVVASLDFSHYRDKQTAQQFDATTMKAIKAGDTQSMMNYTSDSVDSVPALVSFIESMKIQRATMQYHEQANSADYPTTGTEFTTGYIMAIYQ